MLEQADIERLREIFVPRIECDKDMDGVKAKLSDDSARLAVIENQLKMILWVLAGVGSGIITMLIKMFFGE